MMTVKQLLEMQENESIDLKLYTNLIMNSKKTNWEHFANDYIIGNNPQQGIHWVGEKLTNQTYHLLKAVLVRSMTSAELPDQELNDGKYKYCFRLDNGIINYKIQPNMVLIQQRRFQYPIHLFVQNGKERQLIFKGKYKVCSIIRDDKFPHVILEKL